MIGLMGRMHDRIARRGDDEGGVALLMAILFMVIMAGISTVLVSVVLSQLYPTNLAQKSTKTIYAAQAGLQAALGLIRTATDGGGVGDPTELPCSIGGNVSGTSTDGVSYSATVSYYTLDPTGKDATWLATTPSKVACPVSATGVQPAYAVIVSQGTATTIPGAASTVGNRTLSAIYKFKFAVVNVPGGRIYDYNKNFCLEAVSSAAGSLVSFVAAASCTNDALELWIYDTDYEIKLASTTTGGVAGLCITGPAKDGDSTQNATLQPCKAKTDAARWNQLWSWDGNNAWAGQKVNIASGYSNYYLATGYADGTALAGKSLQVWNGGAKGGFAPTSQVGAGAASILTTQIVNYKEFGRCADVSETQIGYAYMISYPCKQDASGTGTFLNWNHKWSYTEPTSPATELGGQQISVNNGTKYCLTTPTGNGIYPTFSSCSGSAQQNWKRVGNTGTWTSSYLLVDNSGRCLTADPTDLHKSLWSKLTVVGCNGTDYQKWNAPPTYSNSTVASYKEVSP